MLLADFPDYECLSKIRLRMTVVNEYSSQIQQIIT